MAELELLCGCMFAGKTAALISALEQAAAAGLRVRAFKHTSDDRYGLEHLVTHDGRHIPATPVNHVALIRAALPDADVIGIDEIQFFGAAAIELCGDIVGADTGQTNDAGAAPGRRLRRLICAGIDHDIWGREFWPLPQLKRLATSVRIFTAPCGLCGDSARYSQRLTPILNGQFVGGPEAYSPRCARCFVPCAAPAPAYV